MSDRPRTTGTVPKGHRTLHLAPVETWTGQQDQPHYLPEAFASDGFIHCTDGANELMDVGNRYYRSDRRAFFAVEIDCDRVTAPVVYDDLERNFPHIYGPLDRQAVESVRSVIRDGQGRFVAIEG